MHKKFVLLAVGAMLIATIGCGADHPPVEVVTGTVMYNGAPLVGATISFHPDEQNVRGSTSRVSSGETDPQGVFRLITNYMDGGSVIPLDGAPLGTYKVTVTKLKKKQYAEVEGAPDMDGEEGGGINAEYFAEMGTLTEDGGSDFKEESLISIAFRLSYQTPLKDIEVIEGDNNFTIDLNENGTGSVK
tara:strand:- start:504 stop:1067 length:564 start_codon:yes stop_codon:yes gene_type:complete